MVTPGMSWTAGLSGQARQLGKLEEGDAFRVFISLLFVNNPIVRIPNGDRRERLGTWIKLVRPALQTNRRLDVIPIQTAIGDFAAGLADILANGEVEIVSRHSQLLPADPELQQPRIDIDQRGASKACQQPGGDGIVEIYQHVSPLEDRLGFGLGHVEVAPRRFDRGVVRVNEINYAFSAQAILLHPSAKRGQCGGVLFRVALGAKTFQPVHLATQLPQPLRVLHINPPVPAAFGKVHHIVR